MMLGSSGSLKPAERSSPFKPVLVFSMLCELRWAGKDPLVSPEGGKLTSCGPALSLWGHIPPSSSMETLPTFGSCTQRDSGPEPSPKFC